MGPAPDRSGWLGRTLDVIGSNDNPLQGIHVGWGQDPSMVSRRAPVASVSSPSDFGFYIPDVWDEKAFLPTYRRLSRARAKHPGLAAVRAMYGNTIETHDRLAPLAKDDKPAPPPLAYPEFVWLMDRAKLRAISSPSGSKSDSTRRMSLTLPLCRNWTASLLRRSPQQYPRPRR